jgi:hypothetical protein
LTAPRLHGALESISTPEGRRLGLSPPRKSPLVLKPDNISGIRFESALSRRIAPSISRRAGFVSITATRCSAIWSASTATRRRSKAGLAEQLKSPKRAFSSLQFSAHGFKVLYEGPNGPDEWKTGRTGHGWTYKDGTLIANGADILGRDFGLTNSSSLEFDLAWSGTFSLTVTVYAQTIERFDYSTSAYVFYFNPGGVSIQRIQAGAGAMMLGRADIPEMLNEKSRAAGDSLQSRRGHALAVRQRRAGATLERFPRGFVSSGSGVVFLFAGRIADAEAEQHQAVRVGRPVRAGEFTSTNKLTDDVVFLANKDKVVGKVEGVGRKQTCACKRARSTPLPPKNPLTKRACCKSRFRA